MVAKISISLGEDDVAYLDEEVLSGRFASRSAAIHHAIALLRESALADAYAEAYGAWDDSGDAQVWNAAGEDGFSVA